MEILNISRLRNKAEEQIKASGRAAGGDGGASFKKHISSCTASNYTKVLTSLADEINKQGIVICEKGDIKELKRYKETISAFLQEAVRYSFEFDKQNKFDSFGRFKVYAKIKRINQKVEQLTQEFLKEQKDSLEILSLVDDIKGLILNIIL